jgi:hypothetical protein
MAWIGVLAAGLDRAGAAESAAVQVRLYDYAQVSSATLDKAKTKASAILKQAGLRIAWAECTLNTANALDPACERPITPLHLQVRILDTAMAKRAGTSRHSLGYAVISGGFDSIAAVFFHRAVDLEAGNPACRPSILGAMLAHEIGHLLLGEVKHSRTSLMRASWDDKDLKAANQGRLLFTPEQSQRMLLMVSKRQAVR